ncbi:MAG: hypothetical protein LBQ22_03235 [Bacteroidales bacterium]|nr:hypothetical protein [Bacteroidales bacterium]
MKIRESLVNLYLIKIFIIAFIVINIISCGSKQSGTVNDLKKETEVFSWYLGKLGYKIDDEKRYYYLLSSVGCSGCKVNFESYYSKPQNATDSITIIMTKRAYDNRNEELMLKTIIDTPNIMDNLNWDYGGIIYIETKNEKIECIYNFDTEDVLKLIEHE